MPLQTQINFRHDAALIGQRWGFHYREMRTALIEEGDAPIPFGVGVVRKNTFDQGRFSILVPTVVNTPLAGILSLEHREPSGGRERTVNTSVAQGEPFDELNVVREGHIVVPVIGTVAIDDPVGVKFQNGNEGYFSNLVAGDYYDVNAATAANPNGIGARCEWVVGTFSTLAGDAAVLKVKLVG